MDCRFFVSLDNQHNTGAHLYQMRLFHTYISSSFYRIPELPVTIGKKGDIL